ncbi:hypothetical protein GY45DRAFT_1323601 [Cubamyces sp. BRFM 1775]|nr:hypothetical protein GY45DRAFT_1323601 [Cubamyces sp. BRFM 1775]
MIFTAPSATGPESPDRAHTSCCSLTSPPHPFSLRATAGSPPPGPLTRPSSTSSSHIVRHLTLPRRDWPQLPAPRRPTTARQFPTRPPCVVGARQLQNNMRSTSSSRRARVCDVHDLAVTSCLLHVPATSLRHRRRRPDQGRPTANIIHDGVIRTRLVHGPPLSRRVPKHNVNNSYSRRQTPPLPVLAPTAGLRIL